jgi:hypothetical protein
VADFVAVLRKTLDGLGETTPEVRARVYDKARSTIAAKLAAIDPPPPATVAERQKRALEDAIRQVEARYPKSAPNNDPLAELENIFSSIDRNRSAPNHARRASKPQPMRPSQNEVPPPPPRNKPAPNIDEEVTQILSELEKEVVERPEIATPNRRSAPPLEPSATAGPHYQIRGGRLAGSLSPPGDAEVEIQRKLHSNLKLVVRDAIALVPSIKNRFPELARTLESYDRIVNCDTNELDVVNLWSIGSALYSFESAYRNQNIIRTLSEPIEPQIESALHNIARLHGAFVMGFEEGRDLVNKSDAFMHEEELINNIREPGDKLITIFSENADLVEARTRENTKPIADYVHEFGWTGTRTGYAAYTIVRNSILALLRGLIGKPTSVLDAGQKAIAIAAIAGYSSSEFSHVALPIFLRNSSNILAFVNHSPEFRAYVEWALILLKEDQK